MQFEYGGHACIRLSDEKVSLIIDPFCDIGYKVNLSSADYCICSHDHFDHNAIGEVEVKKVICKNEYLNYPWLKVIDTYHDEDFGKKRGKNSVFVIKMGGFTICHLGDLGEPYNANLCDKLGKIDILLIPVGGKYTIDAKESIKYAQKIAPKIIIPIHYKTTSSTVDISSKEEFISHFSNLKKSARKFEINDLPSETTVIYIDDSEF